jgi:DNA-binding Lrp family transcriptional regulator
MGCELPRMERDLLAALQEGLEIRSRPYARLASRAGLSEAMALELIEQWIAAGFIKRFGVILRHRELGYHANAMCVWDVPDPLVSDVGARLAAELAVTLCYRRTRVARVALQPVLHDPRPLASRCRARDRGHPVAAWTW